MPFAMSAHKQAVLRLYRHLLKDSKSWSIDRTVWFTRAAAIRQEFEQNRDKNPQQAAALLAKRQVWTTC